MGGMRAANSLIIGLRKNGKEACKHTIAATLLKFKEKRPMVLELCNAYFEPSLKCVNLQDVIEEVVPCITNTAPGVRTGAIRYVETIAKVTYIDILQNVQD